MAEVKKFYYVNDPDVILKDTKGITSDPASRYLLNPSTIIEHLDSKLDKADLSTEIQAYIQAGEGIHIEEVIGEDEHHTPHLVIKTTGGAAIDLSEYAKKTETVAKTDYDTKVAAIDEAVGKRVTKDEFEEQIFNGIVGGDGITIQSFEDAADGNKSKLRIIAESHAVDLTPYETKLSAETTYLKLEDIETKVKEKGFITQADLQPILDAIKALKGE